MPEKTAVEKSKYVKPLKALALSACMLLLGGGLCGIDTHFHPAGTFLSGFGALFIVIAEFVIAASILVILVYLITDFASRLSNSFKK